MSEGETVIVAVLALGAGVALGMAFEHQRFLKEIQGLTKKHTDDLPKEPQIPKEASPA